MPHLRKKLLIISFCLLLGMSFLSRIKTPKVEAEIREPSGSLVCSEPIPTGNTWHDVLGIMRVVYSQYQNVKNSLNLAVKELQSAVLELNENPNICDFRACSPEIINQGPEVSLDVSYVVGKKTLLSGTIPLCKPKECIGQPCPNIDKHLKIIKEIAKSIRVSQKSINFIFTEKNIEVGELLKKKGESASDKITLPEKAKRELQFVREWFHPSAGYRKSCSLNKEERRKAEAGEISNVYPLRCLDALKGGFYWPKPWSKVCEKKCKDGPTKSCIGCLGSFASCSENTYLAKINCRIYKMCKKECEEGISEECLTCLCSIYPEEEKCIAWICGGNPYNYVCCEEKPEK